MATKTKRKLTPLPQKITKDWASPAEACEQIGISTTTLWRLRRDSMLISRRYLGRVLISRASIKAYLAEQLSVV